MKSPVDEVIRNPDNADHHMRVVSAHSPIRVTRGGMVLADSRSALRVSEVSPQGDLPPVLYFPRSDLSLSLGRVENKTSHCPLKGDADYYGVGEDIIAWSYEHPFASAQVIKGYMAFYTDKVTIEEMG